MHSEMLQTSPHGSDSMLVAEEAKSWLKAAV